MVVVEGRGRIAPGPEIVHLTESDWEMVNRLGRLRAEKYRGSRDSYRAGLIGDWLTPHLMGVACEYAAARWINDRLGKPNLLRIDESDEPDGGWDLEACGFKIDVKGSAKMGDMLITHVKNGLVRPLMADAYLAAQVDVAAHSAISLRGWVYERDLENFGKSKIGKHFNVYVVPNCFLPMSRLVSLLKARLAEMGAA